MPRSDGQFQRISVQRHTLTMDENRNLSTTSIDCATHALETRRAWRGKQKTRTAAGQTRNAKRNWLRRRWTHNAKDGSDWRKRACWIQSWRVNCWSQRERHNGIHCGACFPTYSVSEKDLTDFKNQFKKTRRALWQRISAIYYVSHNFSSSCWRCSKWKPFSLVIVPSRAWPFYRIFFSMSTEKLLVVVVILFFTCVEFRKEVGKTLYFTYLRKKNLRGIKSKGRSRQRIAPSLPVQDLDRFSPRNCLTSKL